jgi:hypothetical protein
MADMRPGILGGFIKTNPGDGSGYIRPELHTELNSAWIGISRVPWCSISAPDGSAAHGGKRQTREGSNQPE